MDQKSSIFNLRKSIILFPDLDSAAEITPRKDIPKNPDDIPERVIL